MSFEPFRSAHAIAEVVFGLVFDRMLSPVELAAFFGSHDKFKERLPGKGQVASFPMAFGGAPIAVQGSGFSFDRFGGAGNILQRLRLEGNAVFLNTLEYSRWADVSAQAFKLLDEALEVSIQAMLPVRSVVLQYVDVFEWKDEASNYDLTSLLNDNRKFYPESIFDRGQFWHHHQGWYRSNDIPIEGRVLERITTDGILNEEGKPIVRIDCHLAYEFADSFPFVSVDDRANNRKSISEIFEFLHTENKTIMGGCLTEAMRKKINL